MEIFSFLLPAVLLIAASLVLFMFGIVKGQAGRAIAPWVALGALVAAFVVSLVQLAGDGNASVADWTGAVVKSDFGSYVNLITSGVGMLLLLLCWPTNDDATGNTALRFGPDAGDYFATTLTGGNSSWPLGVTRSTLEQTVALPAHADAAVRVRVDAYTARDRVGFELVWLTDDATGGLVPLDAVDLGEYGGSNGGSLAQVGGVYDVPLGATHATFRSLARLTDGYWIDAGFDNASLLMAQPIPEPATAGVLALAAGALALRRRG